MDVMAELSPLRCFVYPFSFFPARFFLGMSLSLSFRCCLFLQVYSMSMAFSIFLFQISGWDVRGFVWVEDSPWTCPCTSTKSCPCNETQWDIPKWHKWSYWRVFPPMFVLLHHKSYHFPFSLSFRNDLHSARHMLISLLPFHLKSYFD